MKNLFTAVIFLTFFCLLFSENTKANVYASKFETSNTGSGGKFDGDFSDGSGIRFSFFLNDSAKSVIIEVKDASNDNVVATINAGAMSRGKQFVDWDGTGTESGKTYYYEVTAEQDNYSPSMWEVFFDSGDIDIYSRGTDIITDMKNPLFGVFMAPNNGGPLGKGITLFNPDGSFFDPLLVFPDPGDGSVWGSTSDPIVGGIFDDLNRFYVSVIDKGEIKRLDLDSTLTTVIGGRTSPKGIFVTGTGAERKIYVCDEKQVVRFNIGDDNVFTNFPEVVGNFTNAYTRNVALDDSGYMYVSFRTDPIDLDADGAGLFKFDISGSLPITEADALWQIDGTTSHKIADIQFDFGNDRNTNTDDILYFAARAGSGSPDDGIWRVNDINASGFSVGISPIILEDRLYPNDADFNINSRSGLALDAAGNLILMENSNEHVFFITPPSEFPTNSFTSMSPDSFKVDKTVGIENKNIPGEYSLEQNFPNPFNPSTTIRFTLPAASYVDLRIYNVLGKEAAVLINNTFKPAGIYDVKFSAANLPSGTYIYQLITNNKIDSRKMILLK